MQYETDLTDAQWNCIKGLIHEQKTGQEGRVQFPKEEF
jgi:transposase